MKGSLIALLFTSVAYAAPEIILAPVDHLYVPEGFDSNDSVEVVVTGTFPNTCFSRNNVAVNVKGDIIDIKVTAIAPDERAASGERFCPQVLVPFKEVIGLGNLQGGEYEIRVNEEGAKKVKDTLFVHEATSNSVDDNIYASLDYVEKKTNQDYVLHGWKYSNCLEMKEIQVVSNNKDTLSILPVMKTVSEHCPMKGMPVAYPVKLNFDSLKMKQPLLHVRTMDGKSINSIVNLEQR
jgi:hypothetical protein